jgi:hypothetical protein
MFAMIFKCFSRYFHKYFRHLFHLSFFLYVAIVVFGCFKSKSVLHMRRAWKAVGSADDVPGSVGDVRRWRRSTADALSREPDALGACSLPVRAVSKHQPDRTSGR